MQPNETKGSKGDQISFECKATTQLVNPVVAVLIKLKFRIATAVQDLPGHILKYIASRNHLKVPKNALVINIILATLSISGQTRKEKENT